MLKKRLAHLIFNDTSRIQLFHMYESKLIDDVEIDNFFKTDSAGRSLAFFVVDISIVFRKF